MIKTLNGQIYDAIEIDNKTTELETRIENIVIAGGGVDPTVFQETVHRLDAEDTTLKSRVTELETNSTTFDERLTVLEETGDAVPSTTFNEAINRLDAEDTAIKDRLTELEAGGSTSAEDKNLIIKLEVISPEALDDGISISNLRFAEETNFNALFEKAKTGEYNATVNLIVGKDDSSTIYYSTKPAQLQVITENTDGKPLIFCSVIFDLGGEVITNFISIKSDMNGNCTLESASGEDKFQESKLASKDAVDALDARVTALENASGDTPVEPTPEYTFIVDSQEAFDQLYNDSNATSPVETDYSSVLIKEGYYETHIGNGLRLDNENCPIGQIVGEELDGTKPIVVFNTQYGFYCNNRDNQITHRISNIEFQVQNSICVYMFHAVKNIDHCLIKTTYESNSSPATTGYCAYNCINVSNCTFSSLIEGKATYPKNFIYAYNTTCTSCIFNLYVYNDNLKDVIQNSTCIDCTIDIGMANYVEGGTITKTIATNTNFNNCTITNRNNDLNRTTAINAASSIYNNCTFNNCTLSHYDVVTSNTSESVGFYNNCTFDTCSMYMSGNIYSAIFYATTTNSTPFYITNSSLRIDAKFKLFRLSSNVVYSSIVRNYTKLQNVSITFPGTGASTEDGGLYAVYYKCSNIENCTHALEGSYTKPNIAVFDTCNNISNCALNTDCSAVFKNCTQLSNCTVDAYRTSVYAKYNKNVGGYYVTQRAYFVNCTQLNSCVVKLNTSTGTICDPVTDYTLRYEFIAYESCRSLTNCTVDMKQYTVGNIYTMDIMLYNNCVKLTDCNHVIDSLSTPLLFNYTASYIPETFSLTYTQFKACSDISGYTSMFKTSSYSGQYSYYTQDFAITNKNSSVTMAINYYVFDKCKYLQNITLPAKYTDNTYSTVKTGTYDTASLLKLSSIDSNTEQGFRDCTSIQNAITMQTNASTGCTGVRYCIGNFDTATCSASQTYAADYAVADTPAGGFNKTL